MKHYRTHQLQYVRRTKYCTYAQTTTKITILDMVTQDDRTSHREKEHMYTARGPPPSIHDLQ